MILGLEMSLVIPIGYRLARGTTRTFRALNRAGPGNDKMGNFGFNYEEYVKRHV